MLEGVEILGQEMDFLRERFNIKTRTEMINRAKEWVQDWLRSWSPDPLQAGRNEMGKDFPLFCGIFFFLRISAGV